MLWLFRTLFLAGAVLTLAGCNQETAPPAQSSDRLAAQAQSETPATATEANNGASPVAGGATTGGMCGGIAGIACADRVDYCHYPDGVCVSTADATGTCTKRPEICTTQFQPVCGCDGKTYGNSCDAALNGVSVAAVGECVPGGD